MVLEQTAEPVELDLILIHLGQQQLQQVLADTIPAEPVEDFLLVVAQEPVVQVAAEPVVVMAQPVQQVQQIPVVVEVVVPIMERHLRTAEPVVQVC